MSRNYERLSIRVFGDHLLRTGDLDPVYIALTNVDWHWKTLYQWLIAYWCFYSCGFASWVAGKDGREFWGHMIIAAENKSPTPFDGRWPRGRERRHFRGQQGISAVRELAGLYGDRPYDMVRNIMNGAPDYQEVTKRVRSHRGFGPWIAFKVADMTDRVLKQHVDFTEAAIFMFKDPVKAAFMYWNQQHGRALELITPVEVDRVIHQVVKELIAYFAETRGHMAPPMGDRLVGLQEIETILCKWKSHLHGHYPLFNDIVEISEGLEPWIPHSNLAHQFGEKLPKKEE